MLTKGYKQLSALYIVKEFQRREKPYYLKRKKQASPNWVITVRTWDQWKQPRNSSILTSERTSTDSSQGNNQSPFRWQASEGQGVRLVHQRCCWSSTPKKNQEPATQPHRQEEWAGLITSPRGRQNYVYFTDTLLVLEKKLLLVFLSVHWSYLTGETYSYWYGWDFPFLALKSPMSQETPGIGWSPTQFVRCMRWTVGFMPEVFTLELVQS